MNETRATFAQLVLELENMLRLLREIRHTQQKNRRPKLTLRCGPGK